MSGDGGENRREFLWDIAKGLGLVGLGLGYATGFSKYTEDGERTDTPGTPTTDSPPENGNGNPPGTDDGTPDSTDDEDTEEPGQEPYIDNIRLYDLPERWAVDREIEIAGRVWGYDVDWVKLQERHEDDTEWHNIEQLDIDDGSFDTFYIDTDDYKVSEEGHVDYQIIAKAGNETRSDDDSIEFVDTEIDGDNGNEEDTEEPDPEPYIDNIELYDLPRHWDVNEEVEIEGEVSGYDVDWVKLQERHEDSIRWHDLEERDISDNDFDTFYLDTDDYEVSEEGHVDYQIIAKAGDEIKSDKGAIEFQD
jgi:hypothetical protein